LHLLIFTFKIVLAIYYTNYSIRKELVKIVRILAISGSLRAESTNTILVQAIAALAPVDMEFTLYTGLGDLPHFSPDLDTVNPPASVQTLRELLKAADGVLICTPEYAYGMPGTLKNALDWTVSSGDFMNKPVAALSASPNAAGGERAQASLILTLGALSAQVVEGAKLSVPLVRTKLNTNGEISDLATVEALKVGLAALAQAITAQD
jgi:NAD(P)H-dependent FMN reductase